MGVVMRWDGMGGEVVEKWFERVGRWSWGEGGRRVNVRDGRGRGRSEWRGHGKSRTFALEMHNLFEVSSRMNEAVLMEM